MVEIVKGYSMNDWREDLKRILMQAGVKDKPTTFLYSDVQVTIITLVFQFYRRLIVCWSIHSIR